MTEGFGDILSIIENARHPDDDDGTGFPPAYKRPCWGVYDEPVARRRGHEARPGVYWHTVKSGEKEPVLIDTWVSGPVHIRAQTSDEGGSSFGRLLRFQNTAGRWREWAMPQELLAGDGVELRRELLSMGLEIVAGKQRGLFFEYLQHRVPDARIRCATSVGWYGRDAFVLPDQVVGPGRAGVIFQSGEVSQSGLGLAGTLEDWTQRVAALAIDNPILTLGIACAFVGPLLELASQESAGVHLVGDSSCGKTTILEAARSAWGPKAFKRSWRATANGLEGAAVLHNDCLLPLDELSECSPHEVGAAIYMLSNGRGKSRATRTGSARAIRRWQTFILSTGEKTLAEAMAEGGRAVKAGQSVRLLDIRAERRHGAFDCLHGMANGRAFADAIRQAACEHYGHAGRAFLERLTQDDRDFGALLEAFKGFDEFAIDGASGQEARASGRLALIAMAGELATEYGLTGWPEGAAIEAASEALRVWRVHRGKGNAEPIAILQALRDFIDRHGDSRFSDAAVSMETPLIRDRAGWWRQDAGKREYLFTSAGLRDACRGHDFERVLALLGQKGVISPKGEDGRWAAVVRVGTRTARAYVVDESVLREEADGD